jgi:hypothetical protein
MDSPELGLANLTARSLGRLAALKADYDSHQLPVLSLAVKLVWEKVIFFN